MRVDGEKAVKLGMQVSGLSNFQVHAGSKFSPRHGDLKMSVGQPHKDTYWVTGRGFHPKI